MHNNELSLENCGKYLEKSGKLGRLSGLNIVILTKIAIHKERMGR